MSVELNDESFDEYAITNYRNPNCVSVLEFLNDLKTIKYIKRLINKYEEKKELREKLILNHIIFLTNVFGVDATMTMLKFKIDKKSHLVLNSFFLYLRYIDETDEYDDEILQILNRNI